MAVAGEGGKWGRCAVGTPLVVVIHFISQSSAASSLPPPKWQAIRGVYVCKRRGMHVWEEIKCLNLSTARWWCSNSDYPQKYIIINEAHEVIKYSRINK